MQNATLIILCDENCKRFVALNFCLQKKCTCVPIINKLRCAQIIFITTITSIFALFFEEVIHITEVCHHFTLQTCWRWHVFRKINDIVLKKATLIMTILNAVHILSPISLEGFFYFAQYLLLPSGLYFERQYVKFCLKCPSKMFDYQK